MRQKAFDPLWRTLTRFEIGHCEACFQIVQFAQTVSSTAQWNWLSICWVVAQIQITVRRACLSKQPLWPLPESTTKWAMSECAGSPNSTNCLLPELLEELHKSEMVSHQRNISDMVRLLSLIQNWPEILKGWCWGEKRDAWRLWNLQRSQHCQHHCILCDEYR